MPEQIIVKHEIDLGQLAKFEKALKEFKDTGSVQKITTEMQKQVNAQNRKIKLQSEELGLVEKLVLKQKNLRNFQKYAKTEKELAAINVQLKKVGKELTAAKNTTQTWGKALSSFQFKFNALGNIAANVASQITRTFNRAVREAVGTVIEFESAMAGVRAISGATGAEFKKLREDAIRLGGATIFTARAVADLQINYAKLGFTTNEILNATEATLSLAAATDEGLAASALVAGSTLRAFGLDAIETQRVVDVMAKSFTSSALNLENFTEAMKFLAPVAKSAGFTIEETTSVLAVLADTGLRGSLAGTSLRNIFLRLADPASKLSKRLGTTVRTGEELVAALNKLKNEGIDLGEALELTNLRAVTAFSTLADQGDKLETLTKLFNNAAGSAKEMADIRMDTLKGSITILRSAWEGFVISFESGSGFLTKTIRGIVDGLTGFVNKMKELNNTTIDQEADLREVFGGLQNELDILRLGNFEYEDRVTIIGEINTKYGEYLPNLLEEKATTNDILELQKQLNNEMLGRILVLQYEAEIKRELELQSGLAKGIVEIEKDRAEAKKETTTATADQLEQERKVRDSLTKFNKELIETSGQRIDDIRTKYEEAAKNLGLVFSDLLARFRTTTQEVTDEARKEGQSILGGGTPEDIKKNIDDIEKARRDLAKINADIFFEQEKARISELGLLEEEETELIRQATNERLRLRLEADRKYLEAQRIIYGDADGLIAARIQLITEQINNIGIGTKGEEKKEEDPTNLMAAFKTSSDFVIGRLEAINQAEARLVEQRISRHDQAINELQRTLQAEVTLQEQGYANRVRITQAEINKQKELRERALADQAKIERRRILLQSLSQVSNMVSASTNIWEWTSKIPIVGIPLGISLIATMIGTWVAQLAQIGKVAPKFAEGGEVGGKRHSEGGTLIEAERGEYIINRASAQKFPELLDAINNNDLVYLNRNFGGIIVNNQKSEELLEKLVQLTEETPKDFGAYIEWYHKGTKYRLKKV